MLTDPFRLLLGADDGGPHLYERGAPALAVASDGKRRTRQAIRRRGLPH
ncbi:hypothetical protein ACTAQJ_20140 [Arthrobacter sp. alpha11c]